MGRKFIGWAILVATSVGLTPACTGGCYVLVDDVFITPQSDCLKVRAGDIDVNRPSCGSPALGVTNDCSKPLTLPLRFAGDEPVTVAPGETAGWQLVDDPFPPGLTLSEPRSDERTYQVQAQLGDEPIAITVVTHND